MTTAVAEAPALTGAEACHAYARAVVAGEIVAGRLVRLACARHLRDLDTGAARGLTFDAAEATRAIKFARWCNHSKGVWAGTPVVLEPWECFIVGSLFGWKRADGTRRYRVTLIEIARKNGKSLLASIVGLLLAFFDNEPGAEVYAAATKRDQAKIVWGEARQMVRRSPALRDRIRTLVANLSIERSNQKFEPLGADGDSMDGLNIHGAIIDELHAHKTRAVWDVLDTATAARRQPLIFAITTAGFDRNTVCWEQHAYAIRVLEGVLDDDSYFPFIASLDACDACRESGKLAPSTDCAECDDWTDPAVWPKANPNLGVSVNVDDLARKVERARVVPGQVNAVLRLHMNIWTEGSSRWLSIDAWDECAGVLDVGDLAAVKSRIRQMVEERHGQRCFAGIDLSSKSDITAVALWFPPDADDVVDVLWWFWVPEAAVAARRTRDGVPYEVWIREGFMFETAGDLIDYDEIREFIRGELAPNCEIAEIAYDAWGATQLATQLEGDGATIVPVSQSFGALNEACKEVEALTMARKFRHGGNPVMRWMIGNVIIERDSQDRMRPSKKRSLDKIDGVSAMIIAGARAITTPATEPSVYEERGVRTL